MDNSLEYRCNVANLGADFIRELKSDLNGYSRSTIKNYVSDTTHFIDWLLATFEVDFNADSIDENTVLQYRSYLLASGQPISSINRRLSSLRAFFEYLLLHSYITLNFAKMVGNIKTTPNPKEVLLDSPESYQESNNDFGILAVAIICGDSNRFFDTPLQKERFVRYAAISCSMALTITLFIALVANISSSQKAAVLGESTPTNGLRTIPYSAKLTNKSGDPITTPIVSLFRLYNSEKSGTTLYSTGSCLLQPDGNGYFSIELGMDCGSPIPVSIFAENKAVYMGMKIGDTQELRPRQQIPTVGYAYNSQTIQGMPPGTDSNQIPYIDQNGSLKLSHETPTLTSTHENSAFVISSARTITIQSAADGDVNLSASQSGNLKFLVGGVELGRFSNFGRFGIGTETPDVKFEVQDSIEQFRITYGPGDYTGLKTNSNGDFTLSPSGNDVILPGRLSVGSTIATVNDLTLDVVGSSHIRGNSSGTGLYIGSNNDVGIGTTAPTAKLDVDGTGNFSGNLTIGNESTDSLIIKAGSLSLTNATTLDLVDSSDVALSIENGLMAFDTSTGRVGIGTTDPQTKLHISGGNCSDDAGGGGCTADYAELYPAIGNIEKGFVIVPSKKTSSYAVEATSIPYQSSIIGVVSTNPAVVIDGGNISFMHNHYLLDPKKPAIALAGRVPVQIAPNSPSIKPGDRLTSSTYLGMAMKAQSSGWTFAVALESWEPNSSTKSLLAFISPSWSDSELAITDQGSVIVTSSNYDGIISNDEKNTSTLKINGRDISTRLGFYTGLYTNQIYAGMGNFVNLTVADTLKATTVLAEKISAAAIQTDKLMTKVADISTANIDNLIVKEKIISPVVLSDVITANKIDTKTQTVGQLNANSITAKHIDSENVADLTSNVASNEALLAKQQTNLAAIQEELDKLTLNKDLSSLNLGQGEELNLIDSMPELTVTGNTTLFDTIILGNFAVQDIGIINNEILSLSSELRLNAMDKITFLDGAATILRDGSLSTKRVIALSVKTDNLSPATSPDLNLNLPENGKLSIGTEAGKTAQINASGSAQFRDLGLSNRFEATPSAIIALPSNSEENVLTSTIQTNASTLGTGIIPGGVSQLVLYNNNIKDTSLVYITATSSTKNLPLYVSQLNRCAPNTQGCNPSFTVTLDKPIDQDVTFNWWIVN